MFRGYFISLSKDKHKVYVYNIFFDIASNRKYNKISGEPKQTELLTDENKNYLLIQTNGYPLRFIRDENNDYFSKFCEYSNVQCNEWNIEERFPYKVTRFKHDRMFLLLVKNIGNFFYYFNFCSDGKPLDVDEIVLYTSLRRSGVDLSDIKIIFS